MISRTEKPDVYSEETSEQPERRRTLWIWIIITWNLLGFIIGAPSVWLVSYDTISSQLGVPAPQIGIDFKIMGTVGLVINLAAAWFLFMLRSHAVKLFTVGLIMQIVTIVYALTMIPNYLDLIRVTPGGWTGLVLGFVPLIIFLLYAIRLQRRGILL